MKDIVKTLTQEQKESIVDFVYSWIKNNKNVEMNSDLGGFTFTDQDIRYHSMMSMFDKNELFSISIYNSKLDLKIMVHMGDIINREPVKFIENYILSQQIQSGQGSILSDSDFFSITNIEADPSKLRARKIMKLRENM